MPDDFEVSGPCTNSRPPDWTPGLYHAEALRPIARKLAPKIRFHTRERYYPCSVDWYLQRCKLIAGETDGATKTVLLPYATEYNWIAEGNIRVASHFCVPAPMTTLMEGPLTPSRLREASHSSQFTERRKDGVSLYPLEAAPGREAQWDHPNPPPQGGPFFSNYQLETAAGEPLEEGRCVAKCYCRITRGAAANEIDFTYMFLCAFNGGGGPLAGWDGQPLDPADGGCGSHIGDWMYLMVTAVIVPKGDPLLGDEPQVALKRTIYWAHGDEKVVEAPATALGEVAHLPDIVAYAAWHSHELWPDAGAHQRSVFPGALVDYCDDGLVWDTAQRLVFIGPETDWITYNGLWGANIQIGSVNLVDGLIGIPPVLSNGPEGPGYNAVWQRTGSDVPRWTIGPSSVPFAPVD